MAIARARLRFALACLVLGACEHDSVGPSTGAPGAGGGGVAPARAGGGGGGGGAMDSGGSGAGTGSGSEVAAGGCDLGGRWLVAQRVLATAIGQEQAAHNWFYYEIADEAGALSVTKGLHCGFAVVKKTALAASVSSEAVWPAFLKHNSSTGRTGAVTRAGELCHVRFEREYVVRGATVAYYNDPKVPLPDRTQAAAAGMPGWEDWDGDGQPGVSYKVSSSLASGTVYVCQRDWTEYSGSFAAGAAKWKLAVGYGAEQRALGRSPGSPQLIESSATPSSAAAEHRVWFHRLAPGLATGSDAEICAAIRSLRATLVPEAND